jgi:hypothetical protein
MYTSMGVLCIQIGILRTFLYKDVYTYAYMNICIYVYLYRLPERLTDVAIE